MSVSRTEAFVADDGEPRIRFLPVTQAEYDALVKDLDAALAVVEAALEWRRADITHHETSLTTDDELNEWYAEIGDAQEAFWEALAAYDQERSDG